MRRRKPSLWRVIAAANLAYALFAFTFARRARGAHVPGLRGMAGANLMWGGLCLAFGVYWFATASAWGVAQLFGEAVLVGGLGVVEYLVSRQPKA